MVGQESDGALEWMDVMVVAVSFVVTAGHKVRVSSLAEMGSCVARMKRSV